MRAALLLLAGCNTVFGLDPTVALDAPTDAPPAVCPPIDTAPQFQPAPIQIQRPACRNYTISSARGTAIMLCPPTNVLSEGPVAAADVTPVAINRDQDPDVLTVPALSADGDELFVISTRSAAKSLAVYRRLGAEPFAYEETVPLAAADNTTLRDISEPSDGAERRLLVALQLSNTSAELVELVVKQGMWNEVRRETAASLGFALVIEPSLTSDGLRMVFAANVSGDASTRIYYRDRAAISDPFGPPSRLLPQDQSLLFDPVLTDDCARLYYRDGTVNNALVYLPQ